MDESPELININQADAETLANLPGIGPVLAERIIEWREKEGTFQTIVELTLVSGLSDKTVSAIADRLTVGVPAGPVAREAASEPETVARPEEEGASTVLGDETVLQEAADDQETVTVPDDAREEVEIGERAAGSEPETDEEEAGLEVDEDLAAEIVLISTTPAEEPPTTVDIEESEPASGAADSLTTGEVAAVAAAATRPAQPVSGGSERGCLLAVLAGFLGAAIGIIATLVLLYSFNGGTLRFASADSTGDLQQDLSREAAQAGQERAALADKLATAQAETGLLVEAVSTMEAEQRAMLIEVEQAQADAATLEQTVEDLDDRITDLAQAAENYTLFMDRLRDLLIEIQGLPDTPTPTPSATGTPKAGDQGAEATITARPTRTPRPTATPLVTPTSQ